jgi:hypothetical protein
MVCNTFETGKSKVSLPVLSGLDLRQKRKIILKLQENQWRNQADAPQTEELGNVL